MSAPGPPRGRRLVLVLSVITAAAVIWLVGFNLPRRPGDSITYQNKTLEQWFYGDLTNFFTGPNIDAAMIAFNVVGTNAFPFLLSIMREHRGSGLFYFKFYHAMPPRFRGKLRYPLSRDDVKAMALDQFFSMTYIPGDQLQALADIVPSFDNPRLRAAALSQMSIRHQDDPAFLKLCRKLLDDPDAGIRLRAAIPLAESAIASDPREPRLAPILLDGLEQKKRRDAFVNVSSYYYQQQPPGAPSSPLAVAVASASPAPSSRDPLRGDIIRALHRLKPFLSQAEKDRFKQLTDAGTSAKIGADDYKPPKAGFIKAKE
jgi:hypothetical protein